MEFIENTKHQFVQSVNTALTILWPDGIKYDKVLLFLTDAASYMKTAGVVLCGTCPKLTYLTCLAHGVHNVCEYIAKEYQNVNDLISLGKKMILKATERRFLFKEMFPETTLLPQPVRTRWGSWQNAAEYYSRNFE